MIEMNGYGWLAYSYDELMEFDYSELCDRYESLFERYCKSKPVTVLDLACGTARVAAELCRRGYDMTAVDLSEEMLDAAGRNVPADGSVLLLHQDICALDLNDTVDAAVCSLDGINHLPTQTKVLSCFKRVSLFLNKGGIFVFDVHSKEKFFSVLADNSFILEGKNVFCAWQTFLEKNRLQHHLDLFKKERDGRYSRCCDDFCEYYFTVETLKKLLLQAGLKPVDFNTDDPERIYFTAVKE